MSYSNLIDETIRYYTGDTKRIQHFLKVFAFASTIGELEKLDPVTLHNLKTASIVHDIGIKLCEEKYGSCEGKLQEKEGPAEAKKMLRNLSYDEKTIERVCWLIAHHHTYNQIDSEDYQILVEADFLVNLCEDNADLSAIKAAYQNIFRTESGKKMCRRMFAL